MLVTWLWRTSGILEQFLSESFEDAFFCYTELTVWLGHTNHMTLKMRLVASLNFFLFAITSFLVDISTGTELLKPFLSCLGFTAKKQVNVIGTVLRPNSSVNNWRRVDTLCEGGRWEGHHSVQVICCTCKAWHMTDPKQTWIWSNMRSIHVKYQRQIKLDTCLLCWLHPEVSKKIMLYYMPTSILGPDYLRWSRTAILK